MRISAWPRSVRTGLAGVLGLLLSGGVTAAGHRRSVLGRAPRTSNLREKAPTQ
jgi:hypothetical protein